MLVVEAGRRAWIDVRSMTLVPSVTACCSRWLVKGSRREQNLLQWRRGDFVVNPFNELAARSQSLFLAVPCFTHAEPLLEGAENGKRVQLLVGLNAATDANALKAIHGRPEVVIRFLTHGFHAKIYVSDHAALLGSSNAVPRALGVKWAKTRLAEEPSDLDGGIENAVGRAEPPNVAVESRGIRSERVFLEGLR